MIGHKTCATCKYYKPMSMMDKKERREFLLITSQLGIENPEKWGFCYHNPKLREVVFEYDGEECPGWEKKEEYGGVG